VWSGFSYLAIFVDGFFLIYDLRFGCFPITWASARPKEHTWRCSPVGSEVLVKVFLAHSLLPGFLSNLGPILGGNGGQGPAEMPGKFLGPDEILRGLLRFN